MHKHDYKTPWFVYVTLLFLLITRISTMVLMPLNDKTEARYGEIARLMLASQNWVTPQQSLGEPFWAKPPLSIWSSALSMKVFGVHAWSARLPALFYAVGVLWLLGWVMQKRYSIQYRDYVWLILSGTPYFFINAGVVMTDPAFVFSITLSMISGWLAISHASRSWGWLFFIGLGLGFLSKGPLTAILVFLPLFIWMCVKGRYRYVWKNLPWISGSLLTTLIALPWYLVAERRTPGFLQYFIVGEHFSRFLKSGWTGDKYGFAHAFPFGFIWIFLVLGLMPWLIFVCYDAVKNRKQTRGVCAQDGWVAYLSCFALVPLIFFTFSRNIIYTYTFTVIPPLVLLGVEGIKRQIFTTLTLKRCAWVASMIGSGALLLNVLLVTRPHWVVQSQERVAQVWQTFHPRSKLIYWTSEPDFSAQFYTRGQVRATMDVSTLSTWLQASDYQYIVVRDDMLVQIPEKMRRRWRCIARFSIKKQHMTLYEVRPRLLHNAFV